MCPDEGIGPNAVAGPYGTIKYVSVLCVSAIVPRTGARPVSFPVLLQRTGKNAIFAADEFFSARGEPLSTRSLAQP